MKNIYSSYIKSPLTGKKNSIKGVIIHNDAGAMTPSQYLPWLNNRVRNGQINLGFAALYVNRNEALWFSPTDHAEWHAGNQTGNYNYIGLEVCESMPSKTNNATFLQNEEATLKVAAEVMKSYNLTPNRNTVRLHNEFSSTACPHRSWAIHNGNVPYTQANKNKLKDYFIGRIKHYMGGGTATKPAPAKKKPVAKKTQPDANAKWKTNKHGTQYLETKGTWVNGSQPIMTRFHSPFQSGSKAADEGGWANPGYKVNYTAILRQDGYIWLEYTLDKGKTYKYIPVKTWNSKTGAVGKDYGSWK